MDMDKEMDLVLVRIFYTGAKDLDHFIFGYMKEDDYECLADIDYIDEIEERFLPIFQENGVHEGFVNLDNVVAIYKN